MVDKMGDRLALPEKGAARVACRPFLVVHPNAEGGRLHKEFDELSGDGPTANAAGFAQFVLSLSRADLLAIRAFRIPLPRGPVHFAHDIESVCW